MELPITILISYKESIISNGNPSIVILVSDADSATSHCIAKRLFDTLNVKYVQELDGNELKSLDKDASKNKIDDQLENAFNSKERYFLIKNIQSILSYSMLLFHGYGDERPAAKFPVVMIFFTYKLKFSLSTEQRELFKNDPSKLSKLVQKELTELWSDMHFDQIKPLLTRITDYVVVLVQNDKNMQKRRILGGKK